MAEWKPEEESQLGFSSQADHLLMQTNVQNWGLVRIGQRQLPLGKIYEYPALAGKNVDIYIIDTGVNINHTDFDDRAEWGATIIDGGADADNHGHGTAVAGIAAGRLQGVAKKAHIIAVKCLNDEGDGSVSDIIQGLHYVLGQVQARRPNKAVVNLSVEADKSDALNEAIDALVRADIMVVAAAGNIDDNQDKNACNYSPSSSSTALIIGATDSNDNVASFSRSGPCIDLFAPGVKITSDGGRANDIRVVSSGTSFSAPFVSGLAAVLLSETGNQTAEKVKNRILTVSSSDILEMQGTSPNLLLYTGFSDTKHAGTATSGTNQSNCDQRMANAALFPLIVMLLLMT
ncbi:serine protease [Apophysomyces ossiformis]|uniref:Serine protease n=1 Tax=Apophysomyces ossiformis TaxID=679940 RepID=A0A8H7EU41_9FUNG|nr:serine protease [Apophysomyces ossiformis]